MIGLFGLIYSHSLTLTLDDHWAWIALITPVSLSLCVIFIAHYRPHNTSSTQLAVGMLLTGAIILLPIMLATHHIYTIFPPINKLDWLIIFSIFLSSAGYFILFELIQHAGPVFYSFVDTVTSLTGLFWGYWIYHETLDWVKGIAIVLILSAIILVSRQTKNLFKISLGRDRKR
ncbi:MAG: hypothetical protein A2298_01165 [Gammaproteobacteria bacterium RIFOXYB2_FULL_38_6]|nr:MAG: hypothetical protein A2298_01165 [Gammaproteobacteria bacterium RIFOXYB2_FULL_38_6]